MMFMLVATARGQNQSSFTQISRVFDVMSRTATDSLGFMWISDQDGLYKFDGYGFKKIAFTQIFGADFKNRSTSLFEKDKRGNFWMATDNGDLVKMAPNGRIVNYSTATGRIVFRCAVSNQNAVLFGSTTGELWTMDLQTDKLKRIVKFPPTKYGSTAVQDMTLSEKGDLYISTVANEIYVYAVAQKSLKKLNLPIQGGAVEKLFLVNDNRNRLWISTEYHGLFCYDPMNSHLQQYGERGDNHKEYMMYRTIHCDREGIIWLGTDGYGLRRLDPNSGNITAYQHQIGNVYSLGNNTVRYINNDDNGNIWLVLKDGITQVLAYKQYPIQNYSGLPAHVPHRVISILKTQDKSLWIGSDGLGLSHINANGLRKHYDEQNGFKGRFIQALAEDKLGYVWIGTYQNGLLRYSKTNNSFVEIQLGRSLGIPFLKDFRNIFVDSKGRIWISSTYGIHVLNSEANVLATFPYSNRGDNGTVADAVFEDRHGQLWIAFSQGILTRFMEDPHSLGQSTFQTVDYHQWENKAPRYYSITQICQDKTGLLWFRCDGGFMIRFNPEKETYQSFENHVGLRNTVIVSMQLDRDGLLWLGSRNGLHQFDPRQQRILNYTMYDGLQDNLFIRKSSFQSDDGELFFGGINGVSSFYTKSLAIKPVTARLLINDITVLNQPYEEITTEGKEGVRVEQIQEMHLKAYQSSFSISFAAIGNLLNTNYRYQYRLKGFDENFSRPSVGRTATYTNLPPGHYTFEVVAAPQGSDLFAVGPLSIPIYIASHWWQSWPAKLCYFSILAGVVYLISRWLSLRSRLFQEEMGRHREKELYDMKMNFFAKISHEIQTPLSLIIGPLETFFFKKEQEIRSEQDEQALYMIKNNAERLSRVIAELTHVRDREIGQLRLAKKEGDLAHHLRNISVSFGHLAKQKGVSLHTEIPEKQLIFAYDYLKIEHVLYNLLGNAIKFTPASGHIDLQVLLDKTDSQVIIRITDSGPGIDEETAEKVFDIFYQGTVGKEIGGLGIGLALSKEIVQLHNGSLTMHSKLGEGSRFEILLPLSYSTSMMNQDVQSQKNKSAIVLSKREELLITNKEILIVEDNLDMQLFLSGLLREKFNVTIAGNGLEALEILKKKRMDLILSDVMMPKMDGVQLAEKLHADPISQHIPIILLTAFPSGENRERGLLAGTVAYLSKPFHAHELVLLVENILVKQQHAIAKYKNNLVATPTVEEGKLGKADLFLIKLTTILKEQVSDSEFHLEDLEGLLHMSYSVIFKKCQETTGFTPLEYFRRIRIKKAAMLLVRYNYTVSEAAFEVGFTDSRYFSRLFKEMIGNTPSMFKNQIKEEDLDNFLQRF
ncbi:MULTISPECIES: two-component regulator propeller domain-containing protein [unclassified Sphingobacterium]|uniref:two-component regulator propeller domain-containing protein n=1 Tax=unclassified Sphingobacterium TaxID=2609468 RepID=UPI00140481C7|nr:MULTISPECIES: two-component regulator propeller domain-containing protein [unclassified Sphingobacterium]MCS3554213.1 signal transduction histidine kinase/ligand-binding sensor domain-containing protein/DNA-binding response OmpR family regulator [Sphingobacterium sp. JUb21]